MMVRPRSRKSFRRGFALIAIGAMLVAACNWDPSRPFDRDAPQVKEALQQYDAGDASAAADLLEDYLATGGCKEGNIGTPLRVRERSNGSFDLGLALFKVAEAYGRRFGEEEFDGGIVDPNMKGLRSGQVECALRVVRAIAEDRSQPLPLRARARYLEGNLLFLTGAYKESVTAYDAVLELAPGMGDAGPIGTNPDASEIGYAPDPLGRDAAWNRAIALRRIEDKKDASPPQDASSGDGGGENQNKDSGSDDNKDSGSNGDSGKQDKDKDKNKDAGDDNNNNKPPPKKDPPKEPDAGAPEPPPPSRQSQDDRILDQLENAPTVQQAAAKKHGHQTPGMVDK